MGKVVGKIFKFVLIAVAIVISVIALQPQFTLTLLGKIVVGAGFAALASELQGGGSGLEALQDQKGIRDSFSTTTAPRGIIYGRTRSGGALVYVGTSSTDNKYLTMVYVVSAGEVTEFEKWYLDDNLVTLDGSGFVTTGQYANKVRVTFHVGTDTQVADAALVTDLTDWTAAHQLKGLAYFAVRYEYDTEVFTGARPVVTSVIKGVKLYNPTKDSTVVGGDPIALPHRQSDPTTWEFEGDGNNWALVNLDYLTRDPLGARVPYAWMNMDSVIAAYSLSDEDVTLNLGGTQKRYTLDGYVNTSRSRNAIINDMLRAAAGHLIYQQGLFNLYGASDTVANVSFNEHDLRGPISLATRRPSRDLVNRVVGSYIDNQADEYRETDYPSYTDSTALAADGELLEMPIGQPYLQSGIRCQRIGKIFVESNRYQQTLSMPVKLKGLQVQAWSVIKVTNARWSWSDKLFRVVGWQRTPSSMIDLTLQEHSANIYAWNPATDESGVSAPSSPTLDDGQTSPAIAGLVVTAVDIQSDAGNASNGIKLDWTLVATTVEFVRIEYKRIGDTIWQSQPAIDPTLISYTIPALSRNTAYDVRIKTVNFMGASGAWATDTALTGTSGATENADNTYDVIIFPDLTLTSSVNATVRGNQVEKTSGGVGWNTYAYSDEAFINSAQVSARGTVANDWAVGLSDAPAGAGSWLDMDFAIHGASTGDIYVGEYGASKGIKGTWVAEDILSVVWDSVNVKYYKNATLLYTSLQPPIAITSMQAHIAIYTFGCIVSNIAFSQGPTIQSMPNLTFINDVGVEVIGSSLRHISGSSWTQGAYSKQSFVGSAKVSFNPSAAALVSFMVGLSEDPTVSSSYVSIQYAWWVSDGFIRCYELGVSKFTDTLGYTTDDEFELQYDGVAVTWWRNGVLKYTSLTPPDTGARLFVDTSFAAVGYGSDNIAFSAGSSALVDIYGSAENLLGVDAGPIQHATYYYVPVLSLLSDYNLAIGDFISFSGVVSSTDATASWVRFRLQFYTAADALISTHDTVGVNTGIFTDEYQELANIEVPLLAAKWTMYATISVGDINLIDHKMAMINRGPAALKYVKAVDDGATLGDPIGMTENLLGIDAGPITTDTYYYLNLVPLDDVGLAIDDIVSASGLLTSTNADIVNLRIIIECRDNASAHQGDSPFNGNFLNGVVTDELSKIENITIPAGTTKISVLVFASAGTTADTSARRAILNRGPKVLTYVKATIDGIAETADIATDAVNKQVITTPANSTVNILNKEVASIAFTKDETSSVLRFELEVDCTGPVDISSIPFNVYNSTGAVVLKSWNQEFNVGAGLTGPTDTNVTRTYYNAASLAAGAYTFKLRFSDNTPLLGVYTAENIFFSVTEIKR